MPRITARLSVESRRGWERVCKSEGVTLTALIEALGLLLDEGGDWLPSDAIERARAIDRDRYSR